MLGQCEPISQLDQIVPTQSKRCHLNNRKVTIMNHWMGTIYIERDYGIGKDYIWTETFRHFALNNLEYISQMLHLRDDTFKYFNFGSF